MIKTTKMRVENQITLLVMENTSSSEKTKRPEIATSEVEYWM